MFDKVYKHQLDAKNRMRIPAKFREELGDNYMITIGSGGCLSVYPESKKKEFEAQFEKVSPFDEKAMKPIRTMLFYSWEAEEDKQGRILIPENLRKYAKIDKDVVVLKSIGCYEIWSSEVWDEYCGNINFSDLADALKGIN